VTSTDRVRPATRRGWIKYTSLPSHPPKLSQLYLPICNNCQFPICCIIVQSTGRELDLVTISDTDMMSPNSISAYYLDILIPSSFPSEQIL